MRRSQGVAFSCSCVEHAHTCPPLAWVPQAYPHQSLWSLAAVSKSGVAARRAAASSITNAAKKNMDQTMFGQWLLVLRG